MINARIPQTNNSMAILASFIPSGQIIMFIQGIFLGMKKKCKTSITKDTFKLFLSRRIITMRKITYYLNGAKDKSIREKQIVD